MNVMESKVNADVLTHHCGRQMWCGCGALLNACEALSVDLYKDGKLLTTLAICSKCYDAKRGMMRAAAKSRGQTLEVIDGRSLSSEGRMVEWKGHAIIGEREPFHMKMQKHIQLGRGFRKVTTREKTYGRSLVFDSGADMEPIAQRQPWILHGNKKAWTISHRTNGLKLCSSTSVAGVIQRATAILSAQTAEKLTKAFRK
jgi:hypothetical protein